MKTRQAPQAFEGNYTIETSTSAIVVTTTTIIAQIITIVKNKATQTMIAATSTKAE